MSAEDRTSRWTHGERLAAIVAQEINDDPAEELIKAATDDVLRGWAAKIRDVGTAKGWSTWAAAFMDPDMDFVDTAMPSTETIVAELRRLDRLAILREVDERLAEMELPEYLKGTLNAHTYASAWQDCRARVAAMAAGAEPAGRYATGDAAAEPADQSTEPVVVSRYDVAMEPAPEEEQVLTVGAVAEDGRPVALLFDAETRRKVAGWLAPSDTELLAHASSFEIPWPGQWRPLLLQRGYAGGDRWWIGDREGRRWHCDLGFVYEAQNEKERSRTDTRFPLAEAWPLAQRIAAGDAPSGATGDTPGEGS